MNLDQFIEYFAGLFDETPPETINASTRFKELEEWETRESIRDAYGLSVIAMVDEEYDVEFRGDDIRDSQTVEDLFDVVVRRVEEEEEE